ITREASFRAREAFIVSGFYPDLSPGLSSCFSFSCHGSLQLSRQLHIFDLHTLHLDAP
uniref:Uncharacterized protein n=1 Tax=Fundulus heteroclitus TaxID=8078 RepID=A0A3Q2PUI2_FUNHE